MIVSVQNGLNWTKIMRRKEEKVAIKKYKHKLAGVEFRAKMGCIKNKSGKRSFRLLTVCAENLNLFLFTEEKRCLFG